MNKLALSNTQQHKETQNEMSKPKVENTSVRTVHMCVLTTVYNSGTQYSTEQLQQSSLPCPRQSSQYR